MAEFDATKMENAAKQADTELEQIKELHPEGVKAVQDWMNTIYDLGFMRMPGFPIELGMTVMKKWFNSAGYKRLGKILADRWESPG